VTRQNSQNNITRLTRKSSQPNRSPRRTPEPQKPTPSRSRVARMPGKPSASRSNRTRSKTLTVPTKTVNPEKRSRPRERRRPANPVATLLLYIIRLSILGVGIGAIAGTVLTVIKPNFSSVANSSKPPATTPKIAVAASNQESESELTLTQELPALQTKINALAAKYPKLEPGAFFVDLDNGAYVSVKGDAIFSAASTIKIPVLIAFFQDVDAGKIRLDEMLTMKKELIGGGSGDMQYQQPGKKYTALETATKMSVISDNTATNMLIERLGGKEALNQRFREWGLGSTVINNWLPDLEGTNTTTPKDLANLLAKVDRGEIISTRSRDRMMNIMRDTHTRTLLPQGLEKDAIIAHKTGDIGTVLGDAGIIDMPNGKRYIGSVLVKRPHNDYSARTLVQEISRTVYQHFKWYLVSPNSESEAIIQSSPQSTPASSNTQNP
jgi:beta-lactamase class A